MRARERISHETGLIISQRERQDSGSVTHALSGTDWRADSDLHGRTAGRPIGTVAIERMAEFCLRPVTPG